MGTHTTREDIEATAVYKLAPGIDRPMKLSTSGCIQTRSELYNTLAGAWPPEPYASAEYRSNSVRRGPLQSRKWLHPQRPTHLSPPEQAVEKPS